MTSRGLSTGGLRFLRHLLPTVYCAFLAVGLLLVENQLGLTRFTLISSDWGGYALYYGSQVSA